MYEVFSGDDHLLQSNQALGNLHSVLVTNSNFHRYPLSLSFAHDIDILRVFQSTYRIDGDLNRVSMSAD